MYKAHQFVIMNGVVTTMANIFNPSTGTIVKD
jgi:hypothetical protein